MVFPQSFFSSTKNKQQQKDGIIVSLLPITATKKQKHDRSIPVLTLLGIMAMLVAFLFVFRVFHEPPPPPSSTTQSTIITVNKNKGVVTLFIDPTFFVSRNYTFEICVFISNENAVQSIDLPIVSFDDKKRRFCTPNRLKVTQIRNSSGKIHGYKWHIADNGKTMQIRFSEPVQTPIVHLQGAGVADAFGDLAANNDGLFCFDRSGGVGSRLSTYATAFILDVDKQQNISVFRSGLFSWAAVSADQKQTTIVANDRIGMSVRVVASMARKDSVVVAKRVLDLVETANKICGPCPHSNITLIVARHARDPAVACAGGGILVVRMADVTHAFENDAHKDSASAEASRADLLLPPLLKSWVPKADCGDGDDVSILRYVSYMVMDTLAPSWGVWEWFWEREQRFALLHNNAAADAGIYPLDTQTRTSVALAAIAAYAEGSGKPTSPRLQNAIYKIFNPATTTQRWRQCDGSTVWEQLETYMGIGSTQAAISALRNYHYPVVHVGRSGGAAANLLTTSIFHYHYAPGHNKDAAAKVYVTLTSLRGDASSFVIKVPGSDVIYTSSTPIVNAGRGGFYRVLYEQHADAYAVATDASTAALDAAGILDDAWAASFSLSMDSQTQIASVLNLTFAVLQKACVSGKTSSALWTAGMAGIARVWRVFEDDEAVIFELRKYADAILEPAASDLEYGRARTAPDAPTSRALSTILAASLSYNVTNVVRWAVDIAEKIRDSDIPEDLWHIVYRAGVEHTSSTADLDAARRALFSSSESPQERARLLYAIAYIRDDTEALDLVVDVLQQKQLLGREEVLDLFIRMTERRAGRSVLCRALITRKSDFVRLSTQYWTQTEWNQFLYTLIRRSITAGEPETIKKVLEQYNLNTAGNDDEIVQLALEAAATALTWKQTIREPLFETLCSFLL